MLHLQNAHKIIGITLIFLLGALSQVFANSSFEAELNQAIFLTEIDQSAEESSDIDITDYDLDSSDFYEDQANIYLQVSNFILNEKAEFVKSKSENSSIKSLQAEIKDLSEKSADTALIQEKEATLNKMLSNASKAAQFESENLLKTFYTEAFYNDSEFDSEIDIVSKLGSLSEIMFLEAPESVFELNFDDKVFTSPLNLLAENTSASTDQSAPEVPNNETEENASNDPAQESSNNPQLETNQNLLAANQCEVESPLGNQLETFQSKLSVNDESLEPPNQNEPQNPEEEGGGQPDLQLEPANNNSPTPISGKPLTESDLDLCPDDSRFCLRIEDKFETFGLVQPDSSCVLCSLKNINQLYIEINGSNLLPRKVTGNLFELPLCKSASAKLPLGLNFSIIEKPMFDAINPVSQIKEISPAQIEEQKAVSSRGVEPNIQQTQNTGSLQAAIDEVEEIEKFKLEIQKLYQSSFTSLNQTEKYIDAQKVRQKNIENFVTHFRNFQENLDKLESQLDNIIKKPTCSEL